MTHRINNIQQKGASARTNFINAVFYLYLHFEEIQGKKMARKWSAISFFV